MLCIRSFKNCIELRTQEQPLVGKNIGGTIRAWNDPSRTDEVPFFAGCSHFARKNTMFRAQAFFPKQDPCNIHSAIPMRSCNQKFKNRIGLSTQEQQLVAKHIGRTMKRPSRTRRTDEVPFFAGWSHFTRKTHVFVLRLPPQNITHASFMQPFQCDLQQQLQEPHRTTKTGTTNRCKHIGGTIRAWNDPICTRRTDEVPFFASCSHFTRKNTRLRTPASSPKHYPCNIHAAITMRSCNRRFKNPIELRTQEQPLVTKKIGGTIKGPQPQQRGGTFIRRLQPLYTENTRFLLLLPDQNTHATFMLCIRSFKNRIELRTQEQPLVGKNIGGTIRAWNDPSRTDEVPFFAGCSYFCTEKKSFVLSLPSQNRTHATFIQPFQCDHATRNSRTA